MVAGMVEIFTTYPDTVVAEVCRATGLPTTAKYLPSLAELKTALNEAQKTLLERKRFEAMEPIRRTADYMPPVQKPTDTYTGPIEDIRPGDVIGYDRLEEYKEFMRRKHGLTVKVYPAGDNSHVDTGERPFASNEGKKVNKLTEPNPFL